MRSAEKWISRVKRGRCGRCGQRLSFTYQKRTCARCLGYVNNEYRVRYWRKRGKPVPQRRQDRYASVLKRIAETSREGMKPKQQATVFGVTVAKVYTLRSVARRRGFVVEVCGSKGWMELDRIRERCKCGLLMPCWSCIPTATELAGRRLGPGHAYPDRNDLKGVSVRYQAIRTSRQPKSGRDG